MSTLEVTKDLYWVGVLDHKLRVFDVVMETEYGTSYNSYILKTSTHTVLFETAKLKFMDEFISNLREVCNPEEIDYIVVDHTEPDHVGSLEKLLDIAPKAKIVASQIAINFLTDICNREIPSIVVKDKEELVLGNYTLQF
jgi:flavorubredoxin